MDRDKRTRKKGILCHLTSLPSNYGIGGLGRVSFNFIDYLKQNGYTYWQILPLNYPGYGDSPYNPISSFAGNPWLIDPELIYRQGLITEKELEGARLPNLGKIQFPKMIKSRLKLYKTAFERFNRTEQVEELFQYLSRESYWLQPFSAYCHYKNVYKGRSWQKWSPEHRIFHPALFEQLFQSNRNEILLSVFLQYMFETQLAELKKYAAEQNIQIIGDLPLYVSLDSSDTWSHPELFELDDKGFPLRVAGVPPDAFSETGQLWGNPLYRWERMQEHGFDWWKRRLHKAFSFSNKLRLDHFIGYVNYWAVDVGEKTAMHGQWLPGPGKEFFDCMLREFPAESFIAEDLGILTDSVNAVRTHYGFPGMIVLQFCFQDGQNDILAFPENKIIYTGTHDNQTTLGWFLSNRKHNKPDNRFLEEYLHKSGMLPLNALLTEQNVSLLMIKLAQASPCLIAISPMQDILSLDDKARMNIPGTALGNWRWRMRPFNLT